MLKTNTLAALDSGTERREQPLHTSIQDERVPGASVWNPNVNVSEDASRYYVVAELPGLGPDDVIVRFEDGLLSIHGEKFLDAESEEAHFHRIECGYGHFVRTFRFSSSIRNDAIAAEFTNGVLRISVPKSADALQREISVN